MPKSKTHKGTAKRFKVTGSGRVKRGQAYHGHLFTAKSPKRLRNLRKSGMLAKVDEGRVKRMLGGGK